MVRGGDVRRWVVRVTTWEAGMHSLSKHGAIRLLDTKEMNWYTASPTTGAGIFKKRATAFISIYPVRSAGLRGITNPTSLMRLLTEVAEAFEIESAIPHVMAERVGRAMATLASSVSRRKDDEHNKFYTGLRISHELRFRETLIGTPWGPEGRRSGTQGPPIHRRRMTKARTIVPSVGHWYQILVMRNKQDWLHWPTLRKLHNEHQHNVRGARKLLSHWSRPSRWRN